MAEKRANAHNPLQYTGGAAVPGVGHGMGMAQPKPPAPVAAPKPAAMPAPAPSMGMPSPGAHKMAYEFGSIFALKLAARMGTTVPTGYRFDPNQEWLSALPDTVRPQALDRVKLINDWLAQNSSGLGGGYAQNPDFARHMVALAQLAKAKKTAQPPSINLG